jgi:diguanylate cyclase (GGDEF)-like protein
VLAISAAVLTAVTVVVSGLTPVAVSRLVADVTSLVGALAASAAFAWTGWRERPEQRRWRSMMALALAVWAVGQALWTWQRSVDHRAMTFPDTENACYLGLPVLAFCSLLSVARQDRAAYLEERHTTPSRRALILDGFIIVASLLALTWKTTFGAAAGRVGAATLLLTDSYVLADLVLITVAILFAMTLHSMWRVSIAWLMAGLFAIGFSDTLYAYVISSGASIPSVADVGYMMGPGLLLIAAIVPDRRFSPRKPRLALWSLPYVPLVAVCALVMATTALHGQPDAVEVYFLGGIIGLVVVRQLTSQRQIYTAHRQLTYQATHDQLTGVANRALLLDRLSRRLRGAHSQRSRLGLFYLDVDRFKELNDALGHGAGDTVLRTLATRLHTCLRDTDTIARIGGDEFALLLDPAPDHPHQLKHQLMSAVREPLTLDGHLHPYQPSASLGYVCLDPNDTPDQALARADAAMYQAKRATPHSYLIEQRKNNEP